MSLTFSERGLVTPILNDNIKKYFILKTKTDTNYFFAVGESFFIDDILFLLFLITKLNLKTKSNYDFQFLLCFGFGEVGFG